MFDLILRGGTVIDGTGVQRRRADVAIRGDRIAAVDRLEHAPAGRVLDVAGLVVAPGFVDVHNHSEGWLLKIPHLVSKTSQGFTTEVLMSDGMSYAPLVPETAAEWIHYLRPIDGLELRDYSGWQTIADYLGLIDQRNAQNAIAEIPYANVRTLVKGWGRQPADDVQVMQMRQQVRLAMEQGAVGISTGLDYVCQCFATTGELAEVCSELRDFGGLYVTHVRYKRGTLAGLQEAVEIARRAGVAVHISHLKAQTPQEAEVLLDYIDRVATQEVDLSFDIYPYMPGSTLLAALLPYEVWEDGPLAVLSKLTDPVIRRRFRANLSGVNRPPLDQVHLAWVGSKANSRYLGMRLSQYVADSGRAPEDALCDLLIEENLAVTAVFHLGDDRRVEPFLAHPKQMMGSDGIYFADGVVHPRQYGSAPRMLGPLVRDRRLFSLEEAVRKLSGYPAERFGLLDRGVVREGAFADLAVFDPATIIDRATYENPHQLCEGMHHVLVAGTSIIADGQPVDLPGDKLPGRALRYKQ